MSTLSEHLDVNILLKSYNNIMIAAATMDIYIYITMKIPSARQVDSQMKLHQNISTGRNYKMIMNKYWKGHEEKDI